LRSIRNARAAFRAPFESLGHLLSKNRAVTRVSVTAIALSLVFVVSQQGVSRAGPEPVAAPPQSILPANIGVGVATDASVTIPFDRPADRASVEAGLSVIPEASLRFTWSADSRQVEVAPQRLWTTDERYLLILSSATRYQDGSTARVATRLSFTTETAPTVSDFQLQYVPQDPARLDPTRTDGLAEYAPRDDGVVAASIDERMRDAAPRLVTRDTADDVSAHTAIEIAFTSPMDTEDVADRFSISPEVPGALSWRGRTLVFTPSEPLEPGARYAITLAGAHDSIGNPLGGDSSFSFTTITAGQPTKVLPKSGERNVTSGDVELWFSQPMATEQTSDAFSLTDLTTKDEVAGKTTWNEAKTQLRFHPRHALQKGHAFRIAIAKGGVDGDGNTVSFKSTFRTKAAPARVQTPVSTRSAPAPRPAPRPAGPASSMAGYAANQVNAARSAYGFAGLALDGAVSAVANAHAWDMLRNGYFSHTGLDGSSVRTRLSRAGVPYSHAGENICYRAGLSVQATLNWCHAQFMAEPYPGVFNHIGNILNPAFSRVGVGIAASGGKVYVVWDFTG
jgi:uncharacterized protein YkwD